jgi:arginyl-tRNA synthetase
MNLYSFVREKVLQAAEQCAGGLDVAFDKITVEPCKDAAHGEMATNAALLLAKRLPHC